MPSVRLLCLANSAKHNGRCIAGVRLDTAEWVRPVSTATDGTLTAQMCMLDTGQEVQPLDVVDIEVTSARPERHQPENWVIGLRRWRLVEKWSVGQAAGLLESLRERGPSLLGGTDSRIPIADIETTPVASSLAVVRVSTPHFLVNAFDPNRLRAWFSLRGQGYNLSVSDRAGWVEEVKRQGGVLAQSDWYLTISLTEPFALTGACHKLVAAGIEIR